MLRVAPKSARLALELESLCAVHALSIYACNSAVRQLDGDANAGIAAKVEAAGTLGASPVGQDADAAGYYVAGQPETVNEAIRAGLAGVGVVAQRVVAHAVEDASADATVKHSSESTFRTTGSLPSQTARTILKALAVGQVVGGLALQAAAVEIINRAGRNEGGHCSASTVGRPLL